MELKRLFFFVASVCIARVLFANETTGSQLFLPPTARASQVMDDGQQFFDAATRAARQHEASRAYQLAFHALHENPNLAAARKLLGYVRYRDQWQAPFAVRQLGAGKIWTDRFGWLPESYAPRYEQGERFYRGRWMPAETEAKLRATIDQGWKVESEHYAVLTNDSLTAGVQLLEQLEQLHAVWSQLFAGYVLDDAELERRFAGKPPRSRGLKQHQVIYYRTREEYNAALKKQQPRIDMTLGIYFDRTRTAYFFAGDQQDAGTLWHEAAHQLFSESRPTSRTAGRSNNFWAIEGVACYLESMRIHPGGDYVTLGEPDAGRLPAARKRLLEDQFYVPLADLVGMGMEDLQSDPRIAPLYSQSAGLATWFMQGEGGKYREPFVAYLRAVYEGSAEQDTLSQLMGRSYAELDHGYRTWMQSLEVAAPAAPSSEPVAAP